MTSDSSLFIKYKWSFVLFSRCPIFYKKPGKLLLRNLPTHVVYWQKCRHSESRRWVAYRLLLSVSQVNVYRRIIKIETRKKGAKSTPLYAFWSRWRDLKPFWKIKFQFWAVLWHFDAVLAFSGPSLTQAIQTKSEIFEGAKVTKMSVGKYTERLLNQNPHFRPLPRKSTFWKTIASRKELNLVPNLSQKFRCN